MEGMTIDQAKKWSLPFGKYKGELITDVFLEDEGYIDWLYENLGNNDRLKQAIDLCCYTKEY
jgi:uncharacterized protein (DUF3820 family)